MLGGDDVSALPGCSVPTNFLLRIVDGLSQTSEYSPHAHYSANLTKKIMFLQLQVTLDPRKDKLLVPKIISCPHHQAIRANEMPKPTVKKERVMAMVGSLALRSQVQRLI
jgi:hypothetical protein